MEKYKAPGTGEGTVLTEVPVTAVAERPEGLLAMSDEKFWQLVGMFSQELRYDSEAFESLPDGGQVLALRIVKKGCGSVVESSCPSM